MRKTLRAEHESEKEHYLDRILAGMGKAAKKKDAGADRTELLPRANTQEIMTFPRQTLGGLTLADILQAIMATRESLETNLNTLGAEFGLLKDDYRRFAERVTTVEGDFAEVPTSMTMAQSRLSALED
ncbi:hypothetical protein NDU88_008859 [Pleurodeles waltl]|uniref:Uncharacterized protein n=1 Tax=Pleurodeles waltl TaxID=8319 RepID=A0AAV7PTA5_PLEWA|nr:hypothetical protein NDU88_008859 [Pleurodeles waltl]